jgi:hypothetical protein
MRVRSAQPCIITLIHSFDGISKMSGQICTFENQTAKRMQKNCVGGVLVRICRCVFLSIDDVICTRCNKFRLSFQFRYSGMFNMFYYIDYPNSLLSLINLYCFLFFSFQNKVARMTLKKLIQLCRLPMTYVLFLLRLMSVVTVFTATP